MNVFICCFGFCTLRCFDVTLRSRHLYIPYTLMWPKFSQHKTTTCKHCTQCTPLARFAIKLFDKIQKQKHFHGCKFSRCKKGKFCFWFDLNLVWFAFCNGKKKFTFSVLSLQFSWNFVGLLFGVLNVRAGISIRFCISSLGRT